MIFGQSKRSEWRSYVRRQSRWLHLTTVLQNWRSGSGWIFRLGFVSGGRLWHVEGGLEVGNMLHVPTEAVATPKGATAQQIAGSKELCQVLQTLSLSRLPKQLGRHIRNLLHIPVSQTDAIRPLIAAAIRLDHSLIPKKTPIRHSLRCKTGVLGNLSYPV